MAKKPRSPKQLANDQRMREAAAAKRAAKEAKEKTPEPVAQVDLPDVTPEEPTTAPPVPEEAPVASSPQVAQAPAVAMTADQFEALLQRFSGMGSEKSKQIEGVGIIERFPVSKDFYKNPVEELYDIPKFRRFGMRDNFVIDWTVNQARYETKQGQWYIEPRFELTLKRKQLDDEGNEIVRHDKMGKAFHPRIVLGRASFFIDPPADMVEAELAGLDDSGLADDELRERMQFWRYSMWIEERLIPKLPEKTTQGLKEEVINGKAYQIEEYSLPV